MESISANDAQQSLDAIGQTRHEFADRLKTPWWYYPLLGGLVAQMILVYGFVDGNLLPILSALVLAVASGRLLAYYTSRNGLVGSWPRGVRSGLLLLLMVVGMIAPVLWTVLASNTDVLRVTDAGVLIAAVVAFVSTVVFGSLYDAAYRADVRRGVTK